MLYLLCRLRFRRNLFSAVILCLIVAVWLPAPVTASDGQLRAYASLVLADEARDAGDWAEAHAGYGKALGLYRKMAENEPDWQPEIVQYRIRYCTAQQQALAPRLVTETPSPEPADPASRGGTNDNEVARGYMEKSLALAGENDYLRQQISRLEEELDQALGAGQEEDGVTAELKDALTRAQAELEEVRADLSAYQADARHAISNLQSALGAARMEHAETMQANLDLLRQLDAAADEHLRLTEALEAAGLDAQATRGTTPDDAEEEPASPREDDSEAVSPPAGAEKEAGDLTESVPF